MTEDEISLAQMIQWVRGQQAQKLNWLDDFGPNAPRHKQRGSLEVSQKRLDIAHLRAIERELKHHVRTDETRDHGGTAPGAGNAERSLSEVGEERPDRANGGGDADRGAQRGFEGF